MSLCRFRDKLRGEVPRQRKDGAISEIAATEQNHVAKRADSADYAAIELGAPADDDVALVRKLIKKAAG